MRNLVAAVVAAAAAAYVFYPRHDGAAPADVTAEGVTASAIPTPSASYADVDDRYFAGSPALGWADGAAGIVPPNAVATAAFSAATVAGGYAALKRLLVAADLDPVILEGGSVGDYTALVDPNDDVGSRLEGWIAHPGVNADPIDAVTRFDTRTTRLLGHTVKVRGAMTAQVVKGDLEVVGEYRFVYAVGAADGRGADTRVVVDRTVQIQIGAPGRYATTAGTWWVDAFGVSTANDDCTVHDGYINPNFGTGSAFAGGPVVDPYADGSPTPDPMPTTAGAGCRTASRL